MKGTVGAVYDRAYFVDSKRSARSQTAPTVPWLKPVAVLCLIGLVWGCKVGPKYKTPTAPVPPAFKEPLPSNWKTANPQDRSEEHTSELQSHSFISYAV